MPSLNNLASINISIPTVPARDLVGKTVDGTRGLLSIDHCRIVGHVANIFRRFLPSYHRRRLPRRIGALCSMHDVGKASPGFIKKISSSLSAPISTTLDALPEGMFESLHAAISGAAFRKKYSHKRNVQQYAEILEAHHGKRGINIFSDDCDFYGGHEWSKIRQRFMRRLVKEFGDPYFTDLHGYDAELICGFLSLCDWIGSDQFLFNQIHRPKDIHDKTLKALHQLGWKKSVIIPGLSFKDLFEFDPYPEQVSFIETVKKPGVYVLESSTGSGKTEAALMAAYNLIAAGHHQGFYFALPTRVTSNRIFERINKFLVRAYEKGMAPKLIHGQSFVADISVGDSHLAPGGMWFTSNRRALLLPFGIGTIDQILHAVIHSKFNFVRTFGLANKVVIIDELHSYDVYTGKLSDLLVKKLRELGCTVIILSATLIKERKVQILGDYISKDERYPLITSRFNGSRAYTKSAGAPRTRTVHVSKKRENFPRFFKEVEQRVLKGQQVLWILNTVDRAVAVYNHMKTVSSLSGHTVGLIHSRFPAIDRNELERHWIERLGKEGDRSKGSLLISTQVLEQSVDVDADFLITDIAPSDFLIQRIGRLFRHERSDRVCTKAEAWISHPDLSGITTRKELRASFGIHALIYNDYVLWRTYRTWKKFASLSIPGDLRFILEKTYRDILPQDPPWLQESKDHLDGLHFAMRQMATASTGSHIQVDIDDENDLIPVDILEEAEENTASRLLSIPTRQLLLTSKITENADTVNLDFFDGETFILCKNKRSIAATKTCVLRAVKVPQNKILEEADSPEWLQKIVYGNPIPVEIQIDGTICLLDGTDTKYRYMRDCGVYKPKVI